MKFESIIRINDLIRKIDQLSHEVRIQALNSYLVTTNGASNIGFSAVSASLVEFSSVMERYSTELRKRIYEALSLVTKLYQVRRNYQVVIRTKEKAKDFKLLEPILESEQETLTTSQRKIQEELKTLNGLVKAAYKLCKNGYYIAICSKVEVAHLSENSNFFRLITEKVENNVLQIFQALESIQKEIYFNLESDTFLS